MKKETVQKLINFIKDQINLDISPFITDTKKRDYINLSFDFPVDLFQARNPILRKLLYLKNATKDTGMVLDLQENGYNHLAIVVRK